MKYLQKFFNFETISTKIADSLKDYSKVNYQPQLSPNCHSEKSKSHLQLFHDERKIHRQNIFIPSRFTMIISEPIINEFVALGFELRCWKM